MVESDSSHHTGVSAWRAGVVGCLQWSKNNNRMADILKLAPKIAKWEGGYVNDPVDRGGCTNMGVTIGTYRLYINPNGTCSDLKRMTYDQYALVLRKYWDRWRADEIDSQKVADILVDWVYHSGTWGIRIPQQVLGVKDDGVVGPVTLQAVNDMCANELHTKLWQARKDFLESIVERTPSQGKFLKGWLNRLNDFK